MIFRPLEIALSMSYRLGVCIGSFNFNDGSYYSLLGVVYDIENNMVWVSFLFKGYMIEFGEEDEMD